MKKDIILSIAVFVFSTSFVSADLVRGINIDFVTIGNPGNAADTGGTPGCGAVAYEYRIGKYEITNAQWNAFVSASGLPSGNTFYFEGRPVSAYNDSASPTGPQQPTNNVSWYEAAQFCNYLTTGDKSKGAYLFSGTNANPGDFLGINRAATISFYGIAYVIPTQDEWYKAAYFRPSGNCYSLYANGLNTEPAAVVQSNYGGIIGDPWNVGTGTQEQNGTFDMMGNVSEWNEAPLGSARGHRGGSYLYSDDLRSSNPGASYAWSEWKSVGIRVASVPEPCTLLLLGVGGLIIRKR